jgi:hypothetical protein
MLGTPTQALRHYCQCGTFLDSLSGTDRMILDMACLSEYNRREAEAYEKQKKDGDWSSKHPGAEKYPDKDTMWAKAKAATKGEG